MGAWRFAALGGVYLFASLVACGGSEFSDKGKIDASIDGTASGGMSGAGALGGAGGAAGNAGQASDAGAADADGGPANDCTDELHGRPCTEVSTGNSGCDQCGVTNCCTQVETCLADLDCARAVACYLKNCKNQSAFNCMPSSCGACLNSTSIPLFYGASSCLFAQCGSACPELVE